MNTRYIMAANAIFLGCIGVLLIFMPEETVGYLAWNEADIILLQILGALYFGFAITNWTAKASLIGGIYGKPIAIGNFAHFMIATFALIRFLINDNFQIIILVLAIIYSSFTILFGYILFIYDPVTKQE